MTYVSPETMFELMGELNRPGKPLVGLVELYKQGKLDYQEDALIKGYWEAVYDPAPDEELLDEGDVW